MTTDVAHQPGWLTALRAAGQARFGETGLPTQRQEVWKYTGLNKLKALAFEPSDVVTGSAPKVEPLVADAKHRLAFVNGRFDAGQSRIGALPANTILASLADILSAHPKLLEGRLGISAAIDRRPMAALNTAWIEDGLVLVVPRGAALDGTIEVVFVSDGDAPVSHPRLLVALGDMAEAVLVERHLGGTGGGFTNQVAEVALGNGASFRHYVMHSEPEASTALETVTVTVGRDATYRSFALTAGGGLVRREVDVALRQPGGTAQVDGAYLVDGDRHADTTIVIDHQAGHCASRQTQKGVVDDHGRAVYQGKILVRPQAQKTDGYQLSQTLLLSPKAEADVKPELEIHADDVKCSHGATVGRLDADALFFLRARGIPEAEARALLIQGFIGGALDEIDRPEVREAFGAAASTWLSGRSSGHSESRS